MKSFGERRDRANFLTTFTMAQTYGQSVLTKGDDDELLSLVVYTVDGDRGPAARVLGA